MRAARLLALTAVVVFGVAVEVAAAAPCSGDAGGPGVAARWHPTLSLRHMRDGGSRSVLSVCDRRTGRRRVLERASVVVGGAVSGWWLADLSVRGRTLAWFRRSAVGRASRVSLVRLDGRWRVRRFRVPGDPDVLVVGRGGAVAVGSRRIDGAVWVKRPGERLRKVGYGRNVRLADRRRRVRWDHTTYELELGGSPVAFEELGGARRGGRCKRRQGWRRWAQNRRVAVFGRDGAFVACMKRSGAERFLYRQEGIELSSSTDSIAVDGWWVVATGAASRDEVWRWHQVFDARTGKRHGGVKQDLSVPWADGFQPDPPLTYARDMRDLVVTARGDAAWTATQEGNTDLLAFHGSSVKRLDRAPVGVITELATEGKGRVVWRHDGAGREARVWSR